jgi:hypothetical protein
MKKLSFCLTLLLRAGRLTPGLYLLKPLPGKPWTPAQRMFTSICAVGGRRAKPGGRYLDAIFCNDDFPKQQ